MESIVAIAYGVLALVGGIIGYTQAGSKMSLGSGILSGLLLILGGILIQTVGQSGLILATVVTGGLIVVFVGRWVKTRTFMPAGVMVLAGVGTLAVLLNALI